MWIAPLEVEAKSCHSELDEKNKAHTGHQEEKEHGPYDRAVRAVCDAIECETHLINSRMP